MRSTSSFTCVFWVAAVVLAVGCRQPPNKRLLAKTPFDLVENATQAIYSPPLPFSWQASLLELAQNPPRNLMSEQSLEPGLSVSTVAPIASPYIYVLEGQLDSKLPALVEVRIAREYDELEKVYQHRVFRTIPSFDGHFQITFHTFPAEKIIQLFVTSQVPAYLHRAVLRMAQDEQDLRMLGGFYRYAENPAFDQWRRYVSLNGEVKTALLLPGSASVMLPVVIPKQAVLHTYYAVMASNGFRSQANFHLEFVADGMKERHRLCSTEVTAKTRAQLGRWLSFTCDLKQVGGKQGQLLLVTEAVKDERPLLLWGNPTLFAKGKGKPNLLVITIDSLRSDRMSGSLGARDTTPFLSQLARESVFFSQVITQSTVSDQSLTSMLYSRLNVHRLENQDLASRIKPKHLLNYLQEYGYLTEVMGDFLHATHVDKTLDTTRIVSRYPGDSALLDQALMYLRSRHGAQQALWLHMQGPSMQTQLDEAHRNFFDDDSNFFTRAPDLDTIPIWQERIKLLPSERERVVLDYDRRLRQTDDGLRRFFEQAQSERLLDDLLIVLTSNHGVDLFAHHPSIAGAGLLFDTVIRVPMIWIEPSRSPSHVVKKVETPISSVDVAPSILEYLKIPVPPEFEGESILPFVQGHSALQRFQLSEQPCIDSGGIFSFRSMGHKLIINSLGCQAKDPEGYTYAPHGELYDLLSDPQETQNLYEREPQLVSFLKRHLMDVLAKGHFQFAKQPILSASSNAVIEKADDAP